MGKARIIRLDAPGYDGVLRALSGLPLSGLRVELEEGKTTSWVTVTRTGSFTDPRYGKFDITRPLLLSMVDNFEARVFGQDVFIDVAHNPSGGAAGKIIKLSVEGDRLRALVEWTPFGFSSIREKGYRYLSAEYHENWQDNEKGAKHGPVLLGAGLVIRPCIKRLDPIQLSEGSGDVPTFIHPTLLSELTQEVTTMWKTLMAALVASLQSFKLSDVTVKSLSDAAEKALAGITDEAQAKLLLANFELTGKQLADQIGDKPATIQLSMPAGGLTADDVKRLMHDEARRLHEERVASEQGRQANVKILTDAIDAVKDFDADLRRELAGSVADLVTAEMSADQVKKLAETQIAMGNKLQAAKKLAGMGFQFNGSAHISVDSSNEVKALQEAADRRLGIVRLSDSQRFAGTNGALQEKNKQLAEEVLAQYDALNGHRLHREHIMLAGGDGLVSDVAVPATFERTVIREALYRMVGLQFVDVGTAAFSATTQIPYSYRDTAAASLNSVRVYEGGAIPRAGVKQAMETAYITPQKLAFEVSDELRYLTGNGQINWDVLAENAQNAIRIIGEDTERLIFNEILNAADQYGAVAVTSEAVASGDGAKSIFKLDNFPVVRPKKVYDLQGSQVGSTLYPHSFTVNAVAISEYDFTGTQSSGTYFHVDYNLGEVHFVNQAGAPVNITNTHPIVGNYTYATNVYKFDTDQGSAATDVFWDGFLYRYGLRKAIIEDQRYHACNFGLMSGTVMITIEQARSFVEAGARNGTNLDSMGNLGVIKGVPNYKAFAPGLAMGDQRVILGERSLTRYRMAKGWTMGQLQDQKDANGRFTGKKEAYGDQFVFLHTPTQLKAGLTSIVLYSGSARVDR